MKAHGKRKTSQAVGRDGVDRKVRSRVQIENVQPKFSGGRFPVKRIVGDKVAVEADIFVDGSHELSAVLRFCREGRDEWSETPMAHLENDRWHAEFTVTEIGRWKYTIEAWINHFKSWQRDFKKRVDAGQEVSVDLLIGIGIVREALKRASPKDKGKLNRILDKLGDKTRKEAANKAALSVELTQLMARCPDRANAAAYRELLVTVDPEIARFSAWYEMFPRSCGSTPGKHGTFKDVIQKLPYVAEMGFNVLYLTPIHPIGTQFRKGKNNSVMPETGAVGSPWAIGNKDGGHCSVHAELGAMKDFHDLVREAGKLGISIALDIAYQCSPDHPYVKEHPEWFRKRPDNSIQYAENPPKKYQDIYPLDFETATWEELWEELKNIVLFWIRQGVRLFRVDNPHTKDLSFWEWMITAVKKEHPDALFLSEAFTRPKLMYRLAKIGFSQSYNYFPWRNAKWELTQFFTEITKTEVKEYFRANLWPNTPDILTEYLQTGGANAFRVRFLLAATLGASYGIYGPAFELCVNKPLAEKSEEYMDSEKYEIKSWDTDSPASLKALIAKVNRIRNANPALQQDPNLKFFPVDNSSLMCYAKVGEHFSETVLVVVNLDPRWPQSGWVELPPEKLGIPDKGAFEVHDLLDGAVYSWHGSRHFVKLDPAKAPGHIFKIRKR